MALRLQCESRPPHGTGGCGGRTLAYLHDRQAACNVRHPGAGTAALHPTGTTPASVPPRHRRHPGISATPASAPPPPPQISTNPGTNAVKVGAIPAAFTKSASNKVEFCVSGCGQDDRTPAGPTDAGRTNGCRQARVCDQRYVDRHVRIRRAARSPSTERGRPRGATLSRKSMLAAGTDVRP